MTEAAWHPEAAGLSRQEEGRPSRAILDGPVWWRYLLLSWIALLVTMSGFLGRLPAASADSPLGIVYVVAVFVTYGLFYLAPVFGALLVMRRVLAWRTPAAWCERVGLNPDVLVACAAVLCTTAVQLLIYLDTVIVRMYGFHLNGFVWNLLTTRGGLQSLEAGASTQWTFALIAAGFLALQVVLLVIAWRSRLLARLLRAPPGRRRALVLAGLVLLVSLFERGTYCLSHLTEYRPVLAAADTFPMYVPLHWRGLGRMLGITEHHDPDLIHGNGSSHLSYPLGDIEQAPSHRTWNIVWLVAESLRADALNPEVMPATSAFAERATTFRDHFSGGNGTRMGMFAMFYGLYGNAWFPMHDAMHGPVLMDVLLRDGYDVRAWTSAKFTYPEFDRTVFASVPTERLHEGDPDLAGWENDRAGVGSLLASLDERDASQPFFRFMFFESPHARYNFPPESVIREPYLPEMNYANLDLEHDIELIRNRYLNACHHLDSQYGRVLEGLEARGLLDSTIVVLTGDHGEEFLENGHWGHNSAFTREQTATPLVLWVPGREPAVVNRLTSHLDLPATVLTLLGVTTPPEQYTLGHDLFGDTVRDSLVISDWDQMALVSGDLKLVLPFRSGRLTGSTISTADDAPVPDEAAAKLACQPFVFSTLADMGRFLK